MYVKTLPWPLEFGQKYERDSLFPVLLRFSYWNRFATEAAELLQLTEDDTHSFKAVYSRKHSSHYPSTAWVSSWCSGVYADL